jgi:hypothetical protein
MSDDACRRLLLRSQESISCMVSFPPSRPASPSIAAAYHISTTVLCANNPSRQKNQNNAVTAQEEFADETVAVDRLALLSIRIPGRLAPHLLDVLQHHVAVAVKGLDARQQLAVVARRDQDLSVVAHGRLEERKRAGGEFVGFEEGELVLAGSVVS